MFLAEKSLSLLLVDQRLPVHFAASAADQQPRHYQQDEPVVEGEELAPVIARVVVGDRARSPSVGDRSEQGPQDIRVCEEVRDRVPGPPEQEPQQDAPPVEAPAASWPTSGLWR